MNVKVFCILFFVITIGSTAFAQNKKDKNGQRDGQWKENFEGTNNPKFEGTYDHGERIGEFKFYQKGYYKHPAAIMDFGNGQDSVKVTYYTQAGKPISKGIMVDKKREGKWLYFHQKNDSLMMVEYYSEDKLNGIQETFFTDGTTAEKTQYKMGIKNGPSQIFAKNGQVLKDLNYTEGELDGKAVYYNPKGEKQMEGNYKNGTKAGTWKYYEDGKVREEHYKS